jgi:hypothetical protein
MKMILDSDFGKIAVTRYNYIVFHSWRDSVDKDGNKIKIPASCKYFPSVRSALEDLRCYNLGLKLAKYKKTAESISQLMGRIEKINKEWNNFYNKYQLENIKDEKIGVADEK